jgi:hypothetical protein
VQCRLNPAIYYLRNQNFQRNNFWCSFTTPLIVLFANRFCRPGSLCDDLNEARSKGRPECPLVFLGSTFLRYHLLTASGINHLYRGLPVQTFRQKDKKIATFSLFSKKTTPTVLTFPKSQSPTDSTRTRRPAIGCFGIFHNVVFICAKGVSAFSSAAGCSGISENVETSCGTTLLQVALNCDTDCDIVLRLFVWLGN